MRFSYAVLYVKDMDASIRFYRDMLGLTVERSYTEEEGRICKTFMIEKGKEPMVDWPMLELVSGMEGKSTVQSGHLLGFEVKSLARTTELLHEKGYEPNAEPFSPAPGYNMAEFTGPDGELVEVMEIDASAVSITQES